MKILIVIPYFYPKIGGLENYAFHIAKGLSRAGHSVVIVTTNHLKKQYRKEKIDDLTIYRLPISFVISNTPINSSWIFSINDIIKKENPDVINAHTPVPFISDIAAILAKKHRIPFVLTYQNDLIKESVPLSGVIKVYYLFLGLPTLRRTTKIIASSQYYAEHSSYLQQFKQKVAIVPPGVDLKHFSTDNLKKNVLQNIKKQFHKKKIILFIGQLDKTHEHKGLSYLLHALALIKVKNPHAHLVIVGKGNNVDTYTLLTQRLHLEKFVTFSGFVTDQDLPYFYELAHVIVLPSYNNAEGFGMVLIEAGATKKPVVASHIGGIPFVVKDKQTGFLTKPKDIHALSDAILTILTDDALAQKMGKNNFNWVRQNFTWNKQIQKTEQIFLQLTDRN